MANTALNLDSSFLQLSRLRTKARQDLVDLLGSCRGKKLLVLDKRVSGCLGLLADINLFREHGVEQLQYLSAEPSDVADVRSIIFVIRTNIENAQQVIQQVKHSLWSNKSCDVFVYFLPHKSIVCEKMFQEEGISANITIREFPLYFIPLDSDLLSLELESSFKDVALNLDWSATLYMAQGLMELQQLFGPVPVVKGVGQAAQAVADNLARFVDIEESATSSLGASRIDEIILIDRAVDTVTPMCTQLTYEGLLDEVLGIKNGSVTLEKEGGGKQRIPLNSTDSTFQYIRDRHVGAIGGWLNEQARSFHTGYKGSKAAELKELKEFTSKLKTLPQIQRHIEVLTCIQSYSGRAGFKERVSLEQELLDDAIMEPACQFVEDMICREEPFEAVLRIMCLISLTQGGIPKKLHDGLYKDALHTYGHQHILTFQQLYSAGLLRVTKGAAKSAYQPLKKGLNLIVDGVDPGQPTDPAYVFSGYAPISVRLLQSALREPAWSGVSEETWRQMSAQAFTRHLWKDLPKSTVKGRRKRVLVVYIGGVTYAEIGALRFLQGQNNFDADLMFAATDLINGTTLLQSFQHEVTLAASTRNVLNQ